LARATKNHEKKKLPLKFFFYRSKLQAGSSKDHYQMKSHLIRAITGPRPTTPIGGAAGEGWVAHRNLSGDYHREYQPVFWNVERRIALGDTFFRDFLLPNRKARTWRSALEYKKKKKKKNN
jgi:hypothetical protein